MLQNNLIVCGGKMLTSIASHRKFAPLAFLAAFSLLTASCSAQDDFRRITVDDWNIDIQCTGSDDADVTVWLEHGIGSRADASVWTSIMDEVGSFAHVCRYHRPGAGTSPASAPYGPDIYVQRLGGILDRVGARKQIVAVGHSFGGYPARVMAQTWPERVRELVLIDSISESLGLPLATGVSRWDAVPTGSESIDVRAFEAVMQPALGVPVTVISRDQDVSPNWAAAQQHLLSLNPASRLITASSSGHMIPLDDPGSILSAIRAAVEN
ncbi:hypothetical protein B7H23_08400 [Notoacmeibacter marinus]|uniref:AB hydrolase-1 domain-containing protein n=1 Tax=Notoacmeibacter marinus TaxID=1876515 RepID=A0A231UW75_9HYPH|nr:alpha/beta hydrolase [Notoacmeibacter marinus]OXT00193.1 hypothetical protein B7H23_08400 [Notoacmeibacter marinus]